MNNKNVAIIGAGYTGLAIAKKLVENGCKVEIFEESNKIGGIAKSINIEGTKLEKHYRHIFKSDKYVIDLIKELGLYEKLKWPETKMGYFTDGLIYAFGTPVTLLTFKPLNLLDKLKFGFCIINIKLIKNYKKLEKVTAEEWIKNRYGKNVYEKIWEPLLISKFGENKDKISMAWLWGKICLRSSSTTVNGEKLGYLEGSYETLTNALEKYLKNNNCRIHNNKAVNSIRKNENNKWVINAEKEEFDCVVSTTAYPITQKIYKQYLSEEENNIMSKLEYTSAKTMMILSKKSFSKYYWINIGDKTVPFGGIIEHTNMIDKKEYNGKNIIYISNYMYKTDKLYKMEAEELLEEYLKSLQKINPMFSKNDIEKVLVFEEEYAQPIIKTNYSNDKIEIKLKENGLYVSSMAQIYPEDRGMNYAIKTGYETADIILKD